MCSKLPTWKVAVYSSPLYFLIRFLTFVKKVFPLLNATAAIEWTIMKCSSQAVFLKNTFSADILPSMQRGEEPSGMSIKSSIPKMIKCDFKRPPFAAQLTPALPCYCYVLNGSRLLLWGETASICRLVWHFDSMRGEHKATPQCSSVAAAK